VDSVYGDLQSVLLRGTHAMVGIRGVVRRQAIGITLLRSPGEEGDSILLPCLASLEKKLLGL